MLIAITGDNKKLLEIALEKRPSLIIDCGNSADPYTVQTDEDALKEVYVINAEAIYRFRDALKKTSQILIELNLKVLVITTISVLFSYDDPVEDDDVISHCWEIIKEISKDTDVFVELDDYANKWADQVWDTQLQANG